MSSIGTGYDLSPAQFSPDGRVFQIEYAMKAVENSGTAIALRVKDGVVFAVQKLVTSKLHERETNRRLFTVDQHVGVATAGLLADARNVVDRARDEASSYRGVYSEAIPVKHLVDRVSGYMHLFTRYGWVRPLGCCVVLGSYNSREGPTLYMVEPSGVSWGYTGCAIGKGRQEAKTEIEKLVLKDLSLKEAVKEAAKIIYKCHDEAKDKNFVLELSWIGEGTNGCHEIVPDEVYKEAEDSAKAALADSDDDEDEDL